jgi:hypothetical protein
LSNPGALTHRFNLLTYVFDSQLSLLDKLSIFLINYFSYFDLNFLLFNGDHNLRHHTGYGGEIYLSVFTLFLLGIWVISAKFMQPNTDKRFILFLIINLASTPIAAALTEANHSLRSLMMAPYILLISLFGLAAICQIRRSFLKLFCIISVSILLLIESSLYIHNYFHGYVSTSIDAFESYDFKHDLAAAIANNPHDIVVSSYANQPYAHLEYYKYQLHSSMPMYVGEPTPAPNRCIIFFLEDPIPSKDGLVMTLEETDYYSKLRCYQ